MGKIADALTKHSKERKQAPEPPGPAPVGLTGTDQDTLAQYDRETGHLLTYSRASGQVDSARIEQLRQEGTIQRLLANKLIYPTGKLTPRGVEEAHRLVRDRVVSAPVEPPTAFVDSGDPVANGIVSLDFPSGNGNGAAEPAPAVPLATPGAAEAPPPAAAADPIVNLASSPVSEPARPEALVVEMPGATRRRAASSRPVIDRAERSRVDSSLVALLQPHSHEAEQFKILRTNILYPVAGQPPRSILVTSAAIGEGKTFTATNLAISVALNINRHVLLIDADLRRPQAHRRFGLDDRPGLSEFLSEIRPLSSLLVKTPVPKLTLLPGGLPPDNPSELISSERMADLLAEVTRRYPDRLVVIDAPPPALAAETSVLARQADGVLLVVRFCSTRDEALTDLITRVGEQKILGTVMNYMETPASRYYGYKPGGYLGRGATAPA